MTAKPNETAEQQAPDITYLMSSHCDLDGDGHCITCADEALPARVLHVDEALALAQVEINGQTTEIDVSLVDEVAAGHLLLVHGGVALEHLGEA